MINIYDQQNHTSTLPVTNGKKVSFEKYVDPTGEFTSKDLKRSLWYAKHRVLLYRILVGSLIGVNVLLWGFSLWQWGVYAIFGYQQDQALYRSLSRTYDYTSLHAVYAPKPLGILSTIVLPGGVDKYDAVSEVVNTSDRYIAYFSYYFVVGGAKTEAHESFLLPGEDKLVATLGLASKTYPGDATLVLENMRWSRVSPHLVFRPREWQADRINFSVSNFAFAPEQTADGALAHRITFDYTNNSSYGYATPRFLVGLYQQDALVGVLPLEFTSFASLEVKKVDLRSFVPSLTVTDVKVFPLINVYNDSVYLPPAV